MNRVEVGLLGEQTRVVSEADTAAAVGSGDVPVLATPRLIAWLEEAAVSSIAGRLPAGRTSVGSRITVDHLAATPVGSAVRAVARVTEVAGSRLTFSVEALEGDAVVARGVHTRVVVDRDRFAAGASRRRV